jgi:hypothetical protein
MHLQCFRNPEFLVLIFAKVANICYTEHTISTSLLVFEKYISVHVSDVPISNGISPKANFEMYRQDANIQQNSFCVGFAMSDPGLFHGCILLAAMNWYRNVKTPSTRGPDIRQTYLYHKVRAIALVKDRLAQPEGAAHIVDVIALLALVESGMGDIDAAEAHLNAVANLLDSKHCPL